MKNCLMSPTQVLSVSLSGYIRSLLITMMEKRLSYAMLSLPQSSLVTSAFGNPRPQRSEGKSEEDLALVEEDEVRLHIHNSVRHL